MTTVLTQMELSSSIGSSRDVYTQVRHAARYTYISVPRALPTEIWYNPDILIVTTQFSKSHTQTKKWLRATCVDLREDVSCFW